MKILWFVDKQFDHALDITTWLEGLKCLQKKNSVMLVTGYKKTKPQFAGLKNPITYLDSPKIKFLKRFGYYLNQVNHFERIVEQFNPTRIIFNSSNFFLLKKAINLRSKYNCRIYLDIRTLPVFPGRYQNKIEKTFFSLSLQVAAKGFDGVTYITEELRRFCQEKFRLSPHRAEIWTSGVDINTFKPRSRINRKMALRIIYHGSMAESRGLDSLIKAHHLLGGRQIELVLLGSGSGFRRLKILASRLGLDGRINFYPAVPYDEVPKFIQEADIGILPFPDWSGWNVSSPLKLFEYLACGKPVIATKIPAHLNVLKEKEFAFWAETSKPESLAKAISEAWESRGKFELLGRSARQFVVENYAWENQIQKLENFLIEEV